MRFKIRKVKQKSMVDKDQIKTGMVIGIFIFVCIVILVTVITIGVSQRQDLKLCANYYGVEFNWKMGLNDLSFHVEYLNDTTIACCNNQKEIINGAISNKCLAINKDGIELKT